jgi:hypothetical protein
MQRVGSILIALLVISYPLTAQAPLTNNTVMVMTKAGLSQDVIVSSINSHEGSFKTEPDDLVALKKAGVGDKVIAAMLAKSQQKPKDLTGASDSLNAHPPSPPTVPTGIVEAEIGSGDLKPARFANLFVIPADKAGPIIKGIDDLRRVKDNAMPEVGDFWGRQVVEGQCLIALTQFSIAMLKGSAHAGENPETAQNLFLLNADEEGHFTLAGVRSERFVIIGIGKVGMNAAIWISDPITMKESTEIKLTQPTLSCYDKDALSQ